MMKHRILTFFCLLCLALHVAAQNAHGTMQAKRGAVSDGYNFWVYTPEDYEDGSHPMPLVIFLHGRSLCGTDLNRVKRYGVLDAIEKGKIVPAFVLAPQNPGNPWSPRKINNCLEWMKSHYNIDTTRVYVLGMSLGGYGTMDFAGTYPEKVAAAMALCGGSTLKDFKKLGTVPLWIMHGTADRAVGVGESKRVVKALQDLGSTELLRYTWFEGGSHGLLARLFYLQKTYDWLFTHSLKDNPRTVDREFEITREDINQTYQELRWFRNGMFDDD